MTTASDAFDKLRQSGLRIVERQIEDHTEICSIRVTRLKNGSVIYQFDGLDQSESHALEAIRMLSEAIAELTYVSDDCPF